MTYKAKKDFYEAFVKVTHWIEKTEKRKIATLRFQFLKFKFNIKFLNSSKLQLLISWSDPSLKITKDLVVGRRSEERR